MGRVIVGRVIVGRVNGNRFSTFSKTGVKLFTINYIISSALLGV